MLTRLNAIYRRKQRRWSCPHCNASGWSTPGQTYDPRTDHDRPAGGQCRAALVAKAQGTTT